MQMFVYEFGERSPRLPYLKRSLLGSSESAAGRRQQAEADIHRLILAGGRRRCMRAQGAYSRLPWKDRRFRADRHARSVDPCHKA
jgi:hypothetical protein